MGTKWKIYNIHVHKHHKINKQNLYYENIGYKLLRNQHSIILKIVKVVYKEQGKNKILVKRKLGLFLSFFPFSFPKGLLLNVYVHVEIFSFSSKICPNDFLSIKRYCMKNILFHNLEEVFIYLKSRK